MLLGRLSAWHPIPKFPIHIPLDPDANVYLVALGLALVSGSFSVSYRCRQVLRTDPYEIVKSGERSTSGRITVRTAAGGADCDLRGAGDVVDGGGARAGALAQQ